MTRRPKIPAAPWEDCVLFPGYIGPDGYGHQYYEGRVHGAHRVAWIRANGPIPAGVFVCHRCDYRPCVNLDHLFLGTAKDNQQDMARKGRGRNGNTDKTHCNQGHPLDEANVFIDHRGDRGCRECRRRHVRESARRRRALERAVRGAA